MHKIFRKLRPQLPFGDRIELVAMVMLRALYRNPRRLIHHTSEYIFLGFSILVAVIIFPNLNRLAFPAFLLGTLAFQRRSNINTIVLRNLVTFEALSIVVALILLASRSLFFSGLWVLCSIVAAVTAFMTIFYIFRPVRVFDSSQ